MKLLEDVAQVLVGDVGVDLCGADVAVAEHALNATQVGAVHQQVGREAVAHGVGADVLGDASEAGIFANHRLHTARREAAKVTTGVCGTVVATIADEERVERIMPGAEVGLDLLGSTATDEDWTVFLALTTHHELAALEVDMVAIEINQL